MESFSLSEAALREVKCVTIKKSLLQGFYSKPVSDCTDAELAEVLKVINVVLKVHFNAYISYWEDCRSQALLSIMERHDRYESAYPALNFCYAIARNEVGNLLRRLIREDKCDFDGTYMGSDIKVSEAVPTELSDYLCFLSGEESCGRMVIPSMVSGSLLVFCERGLSGVSTDVARDRVISKLLDAVQV